MKKYHTNGGYNYDIGEIRVVDVEQETKYTIVLKSGHRQNKRSSYDIYHDTLDAACAHIEYVAKRRKENAERDLQKANEALEYVQRVRKSGLPDTGNEGDND